MNQKLFDFIAASPTPFHAVAHVAKQLDAAGYTALCESKEWALQPGKGYYITRNGSSLIAFRIPAGTFSGFMLTASHCDSPCFKIKENAELTDGHYVRLSTEKYGGMLCAPWMDRPLSIAGRITVRTASGLDVRLVDLKEPSVIIPNVAIHMNRNANENATFNLAVDMIPLYGLDPVKGTLRSRIAAAAGVQEEDILTTDLFVYNPQKGTAWNGCIAAPRLDDLQCAFGALEGFMQAKAGESLPVYCLFDNEEVGSTTKQGAASTFLPDTLKRIAQAMGLQGSAYRQAVANSFMVSCDNAHAAHPNHGEFADKNHTVYMNGGIVIKYNASQKYTSDAISAAIFQLVCEEAGVPYQRYANRADMGGGSTLGNIANTQVSLNTVDIGLPQLAMHSAYETAGDQDTEFLVRALTVFYGKSLKMDEQGSYHLA